MQPTHKQSKPLIATVSVRGGTAQDARSNFSVNLIIEDWDCTDDVPPKRYALVPEALDATDEAELLRQFDLALPDDTAEDIDIDELLEQRRQVAIIWSIVDVQKRRPDLTEDQCWEVLKQCWNDHDCNYGFTWDLIECVAQDLFGNAPHNDDEE